MKLVHSDSSFFFVNLLTKFETWAGVPWQTAFWSFLRHWCHQLWRSTESKPRGPGATDVATSSPSVSGVVSSPSDSERWVNLCRLLRHWFTSSLGPSLSSCNNLVTADIYRAPSTDLAACLETCWTVLEFVQKTWQNVMHRNTFLPHKKKSHYLMLKFEHKHFILK